LDQPGFPDKKEPGYGIGISWITYSYFRFFKLLGTLHWSWFIVFAPIWIPIVLLIGLLFFIFILFVFGAFFGRTSDYTQNRFR
jgi:hypothetical protein